MSRVKKPVVADKASLQPSTAQTTKELVSKKKDEIVPELTPLEKMLQNAGPLREDATDKFVALKVGELAKRCAAAKMRSVERVAAGAA